MPDDPVTAYQNPLPVDPEILKLRDGIDAIDDQFY